MKSLSIKTVVATGIGAALFVVIGMLVNIPTPVPNTSIQLQYAVQALFALVYGPFAGFFTGFLGHAFKDAIQYGSPWWSWVISSGFVGLVIGFFKKRIDLEDGVFTYREAIVFNGAQLLANVLAWGVVAPLGDIIIYQEPAQKVFFQGVTAAAVNAVTIAIGGTLLLVVYARSRTQAGSLSKD